MRRIFLALLSFHPLPDDALKIVARVTRRYFERLGAISPIGTFETCRRILKMSVYLSKSEVTGSFSRARRRPDGVTPSEGFPARPSGATKINSYFPAQK